MFELVYGAFVRVKLNTYINVRIVIIISPELANIASSAGSSKSRKFSFSRYCKSVVLKYFCTNHLRIIIAIRYYYFKRRR